MMMITWNKWMTLHKYRSKPHIQQKLFTADGVRTVNDQSVSITSVAVGYKGSAVGRAARLGSTVGGVGA